MDIELLVSMIQDGHTELYEQLWFKTKRLIRVWVWNLLTQCSNGQTSLAGCTMEDLMQTGFLALVKAVEKYDPKKGSFIAHLKWYVRGAFYTATGQRTERQRKEPLNRSLSLDVPARDDDPDGERWLDAVPDSVDHIEEIEETVYQGQLHKALEKALDAIPNQEAHALRAEFWRGKNQQETAEEMGVTDERVRQLRNGGLRHIRNSSAKAQLERFLDSETPFYHSVSVDRFNCDHTSAVEAVVIWRERRRRELGESICSS